MKNQIKKITVAAVLICSFAYVSAQVPPPAPAAPAPVGTPGLQPPPPPVGAPLAINPREPMPIPEQPLQSLATISGKVISYLTNDRYAYDGLVLQQSSGTVNVKFPEHLAKQMMQTAKKGETLSVNGFNMTGPDGVSAFQLVTAIAGSVKVTDIPPALPVQPVTSEPKTYSGSIRDFRRDVQGLINGLNLDNKVMVDLPPTATAQLQPLLKTGDKVEVSGFKDTPPAGVVLAANAPEIIHPQTITLNGQTYLVR